MLQSKLIFFTSETDSFYNLQKSCLNYVINSLYIAQYSYPLFISIFYPFLTQNILLKVLLTAMELQLKLVTLWFLSNLSPTASLK